MLQGLCQVRSTSLRLPLSEVASNSKPARALELEMEHECVLEGKPGVVGSGTIWQSLARIHNVVVSIFSSFFGYELRLSRQSRL